MRAEAEGPFVLDVPSGWRQGRGAFGGLVMGALTRAMIAAEPDEARALRSMCGELAGPVQAGRASIDVAPIRRGNAVSTWSATLSQNSELLARASAVLGRARPIDRAWAPPPPPMSKWRDVEVFGLKGPFGPEFAQFFEYRPSGPLPFSGGREPVAEGWIRPKRCPRAIGAVEAIAMVDAYWPASYAIESGPRPMGTVAFTLQYFPPEA